jgi:hypothetical protein
VVLRDTASGEGRGGGEELKLVESRGTCCFLAERLLIEMGVVLLSWTTAGRMLLAGRTSAGDPGSVTYPM